MENKMIVADVMTQGVISVEPEATVADAARLMIKERISGLPVVNGASVLLGIVTEGDLLRRAELGTEKSRPHWLEFVVGSNTLASEYVRSHARKVADVMTHNVAVATEEMALGEAVELMEKRRVKRLPVVRGSRVVGILSCANLLGALATDPSRSVASPADRAIRDELVRELAKQPWNAREGNILVKNGIAHLWGSLRMNGIGAQFRLRPKMCLV